MQRRKTDTSYRKARLRYLLIFLLKKYNISCYLCHKPLGEADIPVRRVDLLTEHHIDGDHENWNTENLTLVHRTCHKSYHTKDNILKGA